MAGQDAIAIETRLACRAFDAAPAAVLFVRGEINAKVAACLEFRLTCELAGSVDAVLGFATFNAALTAVIIVAEKVDATVGAVLESLLT